MTAKGKKGGGGNGRVESLLEANAKRFKVDESEEVQRGRRQALEDFIMNCCTGIGISVWKQPRRRYSVNGRQPQPRRLVVDIDDLVLTLKKEASTFQPEGSTTSIPVSNIQQVKCGASKKKQPEESKCWLTVQTTARPYELKVDTLKVRDQLVSFLALLTQVTKEDHDGVEPGIDVLRESLAEARESMSDSMDANSSGRDSSMRDSGPRDSLGAVWDSKPAFRRSEANVGEEIEDAMP